MKVARSPSPDELARKGFGLFSIRERLEYLGGRMDVQTDSRDGTCVQVRIPLKAGPEGAP